MRRKVERDKYQRALADAEAAKKLAAKAETLANEAAALAKAARLESENFKRLLQTAAVQLQKDIADREEARSRLLLSLKEQLTARGVNVTIDPVSGVLRLQDDILFDVGDSAVKKGAEAKLAALADVLAEVLPCYAARSAGTLCRETPVPVLETVLVEGHTDKQGYRKRIALSLTTPGQPGLPGALPSGPPVQTLAKPEIARLPAVESQARNDRLATDRALSVFKGLQQARTNLTDLRNAVGLPLLGVSGYGERRPLADAQGSSEEDYRKNRRIDLRFVLSTRTSTELQKILDQINSALGGRP